MAISRKRHANRHHKDDKQPIAQVERVNNASFNQRGQGRHRTGQQQAGHHGPGTE